MKWWDDVNVDSSYRPMISPSTSIPSTLSTTRVRPSSPEPDSKLLSEFSCLQTLLITQIPIFTSRASKTNRLSQKWPRPAARSKRLRQSVTDGHQHELDRPQTGWQGVWFDHIPSSPRGCVPLYANFYNYLTQLQMLFARLICALRQYELHFLPQQIAPQVLISGE